MKDKRQSQSVDNECPRIGEENGSDVIMGVGGIQMHIKGTVALNETEETKDLKYMKRPMHKTEKTVRKRKG